MCKPSCIFCLGWCSTLNSCFHLLRSCQIVWKCPSCMRCSRDHVTLILDIKTSIMTAHNNHNRAMISLTEAYREKKRQEFLICNFCCFSALLIKHDPNITQPVLTLHTSTVSLHSLLRAPLLCLRLRFRLLSDPVAWHLVT